MIIELTHRHISEGIAHDCNKCAVGLALEGALGHPVKVTSNRIYPAVYSMIESGIARVGKRLRFYINDFDNLPKQCQPVTLEMAEGMVEIVGEYKPISKYRTYHVPSDHHVLGKCGCIVCTYGEDAFTEAEQMMLQKI